MRQKGEKLKSLIFLRVIINLLEENEKMVESFQKIYIRELL